MMKRFFLIVGLFVAVLAGAQSNLVIVPLSDAERTYAIQQIGKIRFEDRSACLYDKQGEQLGCTPTREIRKIVFSDQSEIPTGFDKLFASAIEVYPNPTQSQLVVQGIEAQQVVRVFSMQGQLLITAVADANSATVNVSGLQTGSYLLQVGAEIVIFIKQ